MAKALETWRPSKHGDFEKLDDNLWTIRGDVPGAPGLTRVMALARLGDGRLVIHSAMALEEPHMKALEGFGTPTFLIVPNGAHRLDCKIYKQRYPGLKVVCPPGSKKKVEEVIPVDSTEPFGDEQVRYEHLDGTREGYLQVKGKSGTVLVVTDIVINVPHQPGVRGFVFRLLGFTGAAPKVAFFPRLLLVTNKPACKAHLERLAADPDLKTVITAHGAPFGAEELRAAAQNGL